MDTPDDLFVTTRPRSHCRRHRGGRRHEGIQPRPDLAQVRNGADRTI